MRNLESSWIPGTSSEGHAIIILHNRHLHQSKSSQGQGWRGFFAAWSAQSATAPLVLVPRRFSGIAARLPLEPQGVRVAARMQ